MSVTFAKGFRANGITAGLKASGQPDIALLAADAPVPAAGLFTTNRFPAAPVGLSRKRLEKGTARGVLVNSGQANAGTGPEGEHDAIAITELAANALGADPTELLACSTGVIGDRIGVAKIEAAMPSLVKGLSVEDGGSAFARAIMTTDTMQKEAQARSGSFRVGGCAKGVGMIEPNLSTMLAFITTDAHVSPGALEDLTVQVLKPSFEQLTVDGCTSTNDTILLFASGAAGGEPIASGTPQWDSFSEALGDVADSLVLQLAADGEGATHVLVIEASGARNDEDARRVAKAIGNSPLVKAAAFGGDPNPGRFLQAIGSSGAEFDASAVRVSIGDVVVIHEGRIVPRYADTEKQAAQLAMKEPEIRIAVSLGDGPGRGRAIGCDLSYDYVKINAEYTN